MRALVFASLCKDDSAAAAEILAALGSGHAAEEEVLTRARTILRNQYTHTPRVLDMFAGGGTIPLEAYNLGVDAYSCDSNELSVFIQRCNLEYPRQLSGEDLPSIVESCGRRVLEQLTTDTASLFPLRMLHGSRGVFGYLWSYSTVCSACDYRYFLSKRQWLSRKKGKRLAMVVSDGPERQDVAIQNLPDGTPPPTAWMGRGPSTKCPRCGEVSKRINTLECTDELLGIIRMAEKSGKEFLIPPSGAVPGTDFIRAIQQEVLADLNVELPSSRLPQWSGICNPAIYGIVTHADFINPRQSTVLLLLLRALRNEYYRLSESSGGDIARAVLGCLSGLIDQLVDWNCRLSMWISQNEQVGRAFSGPGVAMLWDYVETDPVLDGPANLWSKLDRIISGVRSLPRSPGSVTVAKAHAQNLPYPNEHFDAIVTDPPYYDNIYYTVLADFFYAWKRPLISLIDPDLVKSRTTDSVGELVASAFRSESREEAHGNYCAQLTLALAEAARVLKPDGLLALVYSHGSLAGWDAIIQAFRAANLQITSVQPLSIERKQRPRAMTSQAINTCVTFVARKGFVERIALEMDHLMDRMKEVSQVFLPSLLEAGWAEDDAGLAVFAHGVGIIANSAPKGAVGDYEALGAVADMVSRIAPSFKLTNRRSL